MKELPSQAELHKLLSYSSTSGDLYWNSRPGDTRFNNHYAGAKALTAKTTGGYLHGQINGEKYYAHRVIWKMHFGDDPFHIDHINHCSSDNRLENLRSVTKQENCRNTSVGSRNTSGCVGVVWDKERGMWAAQIKMNKKNHYLGRFVSFAQAVAARKAAERDLGFHDNHGAANAG